MCPLIYFTFGIGERERDRIETHLSFIKHKSSKIVCSVEITFFSLGFIVILVLEIHELVYSISFEMNWQHIYMGSSFYAGGMRGTFTYNNSFSPLVFVVWISASTRKERKKRKNVLKLHISFFLSAFKSNLVPNEYIFTCPYSKAVDTLMLLRIWFIIHDLVLLDANTYFIN